VLIFGSSRGFAGLLVAGFVAEEIVCEVVFFVFYVLIFGSSTGFAELLEAGCALIV